MEIEKEIFVCYGIVEGGVGQYGLVWVYRYDKLLVWSSVSNSCKQLSRPSKGFHQLYHMPNKQHDYSKVTHLVHIMHLSIFSQAL